MIKELYEKPFFELMLKAHHIHKAHFPQGDIELCTLHSLKTGGCPENCSYCSQSAHYKTGLEKEASLDEEKVLFHAQRAKEQGAQRFCMGAAWRSPPKKDFPRILNLIQDVKALGLETCVTLGSLSLEQAKELKEAGLDFYNHNIDTSPSYYKEIVSTHTFQDRLDTLNKVMDCGIRVCCGGIMGMGESRQDRIEFFEALLNLPSPPESIPINHLMPMKGTPLETARPLDSFEFIKTVAIARILFPDSRVRLSAGRNTMSREMQAWCFMVGANSLHVGEKLLTAGNPSIQEDLNLLSDLGLQAC